MQAGCVLVAGWLRAARSNHASVYEVVVVVVVVVLLGFSDVHARICMAGYGQRVIHAVTVFRSPF